MQVDVLSCTSIFIQNRFNRSSLFFQTCAMVREDNEKQSPMHISGCESRGSTSLPRRKNTGNEVTMTTKVTPDQRKGDEAVSDGLTAKQKLTHFQASHGHEKQISTTKKQYSSTTSRDYRSVGMMGGRGTSPYHPSPRKTLIQGVVLTQTNKAFRSHRLFPLLKDLAVTDHYYGKTAFSVGE